MALFRSKAGAITIVIVNIPDSAIVNTVHVASTIANTVASTICSTFVSDIKSFSLIGILNLVVLYTPV